MIAAGELVFDAGIVFTGISPIGPVATPDLLVRDPQWYDKTRTPSMPDGVVPFVRYVIREKGKVGVGTLSCAMCHTRVMPDGTA